MKKFLPLIILLFVLANQHACYCQKQGLTKTDSLFSVLKTQKNDTAKVNTLNAIAYESRNSDPDTALYFAGEAMALAVKLNFKEGVAESYLSKAAALINFEELDEAKKNTGLTLQICDQLLSSADTANKARILQLKRRAYNTSGTIAFYQSNYPEALKNYFIALKINQELGDKSGVAALYGNIANVYKEEGNYPEALKINFMSLKIWDELGTKKDLAASYNNIGMVYDALNNHSEALKMYYAALKIRKEIGSKKTLAESYNNIGGIYFSMNNYKDALENLNAALQLSEEFGDRRTAAGCYVNIGNIYTDMENYDAASQNYLSSLKIADESEDKSGQAFVYLGLGNLNARQKKYKDAQLYYDRALSLSKEIGNLDYIKNSYESQASLDSSMGNYRNSLYHYKMYIAYRDSLFNEDITRKTVQSQMQYEFDKKESAGKAEQDKKDALTRAEFSRQKIVRNFSFAGIAGILFLGGYMFYNFRRRKKLESMKALSDERLRISRELHDDIGSTLGSIAVYSDVAKNRSLKNGNPVEVLSKIGNASRELIEKMSDIVWSLNPDNESFDQLQNRMQAFAAMILTPQDISFEFKNEGELNSVLLTNEQRKNIFLIYKEAIHNIVKYAACKNVVISFSKSGNNLSFSIQDDGKGFDSVSFEEGRGEAYNGNGLKNMKARATDMKALLNIRSANNEGTIVELKING